MTRDESLADDLAQDTFMHAWHKIHTYSGRGSFIGWVLKVAYTMFLQSKRKSKRYDEVLQEAGTSGSYEQSVTPSHELGDLDKLLGVLDERERAVLILSYACGLSHREISESTELPVGTIKSIISRAKDKIRQRFDIEHHQHG